MLRTLVPVALTVCAPGALAQQPPSIVAMPFRLSDVQLSPGSRFASLTDTTTQFLLSVNISDIGCQITASANLTGNFTHPACNYVDDSEYYGHYFGHYMSATALMYNASGNAALQAAGSTAVSLLATVQSAWTALGPEYAGYAFSFNTVPWDNLLSFGQNCAPVCVPWYIYHKLLAGLLDQYQLAGNSQALQVMTGMIDWAVRRIAATLASGGEAQWQQVLNTEFGGMNEVLFNAYRATGNTTYLATAGLFVHWNWTDPLVLGQDALPFNHANTHIPQIIGDAVGYEITWNATKATIVSTFFSYLNSSHSYATGGSNDHQFWGPPNQLGIAFQDGRLEPFDDDTQESCTQYNILKLTRRIFGWEGGIDSRWADHYERSIWNGIVGNEAVLPNNTNSSSGGVGGQGHKHVHGHGAHGHVHDHVHKEQHGHHEHEHDNSADASYPAFIKYLPLGGANLTKPWGPADQKFVCCWGTLSESFSKLGDSLYFQSSDGSVLFVNQFVPSTVTWAARGGVAVRQISDYPYDPTFAATMVVVDNAGTQPYAGQPWTLALRVPAWATSGNNSVILNGVTLTSPAAPGGYYNLTRVWSAGDSVVLFLPTTVRWERLNDNRTAYASMGAVMYGPLVLAGVNVSTNALAVDLSQPLSSQIVPNPAAPAGTLQFLAPLASNSHSNSRSNSGSNSGSSTTSTGIVGSISTQAVLIPLADVVLEKYTVYWNATAV